MWWFVLGFLLVAGFCAALYWLSRSDDGTEDMPLGPSGWDVHRARAWLNNGDGPGDAGGL